LSVIDIILGRRLANREQSRRRIGAFEGLPAMGLDGLGSSAYGPEAALTILIPLGAASLSYIGWVMAPIVGLLLVLFASYWQTIKAYPNNGGAYIVSRENLGRGAGLLAAAALMIDYVLNVAVGISAGVGALVSAVPALHPHILPLCLGILVLITIVNLRGTLDAGRLFAAPTYVFVGSFLLILGIGVFKVLTSTGPVHPVIPPPALPHSTEAASLWLLLRAFASGCTAMTGVEAVSNGMTAFREPSVKYGHRTLTAIVAILGTLLICIALLSSSYGIAAMDQTQPGYQSVLSQLAHAVIGSGPLYYIAIGSLLCVLALSANTSFVDFPRLCHTVAEDGFLPKSFAIAGHRLVFSVGILYLAMAAGLLLLVFAGITDRLIPLFAIGAFLTFTLSQTGMVIHWRRELKSPSGNSSHHTHFWINTVGALTTGIALLVIIVAKFTEGAWITMVAIPATILLLRSIHNYYEELGSKVHDSMCLHVDERPPLILVTTESWNKLTDKALSFALSVSPDVMAVHLMHLSGPDGEEHDRSLRSRWRTDVEAPAEAAGLRPPRLITLQAQYRAMYVPLLELVRRLEVSEKGRRIAIMIPEIVRQRWYQYLLHTFRTARLRSQLLKHGGPSLVVMSVPWYLDPVKRRPMARAPTVK
jgi:amino acid transporter